MFNIICRCGLLLERTSADTYYVIPEPAVNVIPLPSPLPPPTTSSSQLENVVDTPGYSEVPVNIKIVLSLYIMIRHSHYSIHCRPILTERRGQQGVPK